MENPPVNLKDNFFWQIQEGVLPDMTEEERSSLYESMSQGEIVRYYQIVDSLEGEKRKEFLRTWIPKPKVLYHASHLGNIESFEPREKSKRRASDPPLVFASPLEAVSSIFLLEHSNSDISGSYDGGKTWVLISESLEDLKRRNRSGFLYSLPPDSFNVDPNSGLGLYEWSSETEVESISKEKLGSAIETMLKFGVEIYVPSSEVSFEEFKFGDQGVLLSKMRRISLEDL